MFALLLALLAIASGTLATYFYDRDAPLAARLCAGVCTGLTVSGLLGFIISSFVGLTPLALVLTAALMIAPLALLLRREWREFVRADIEETMRFMRRAILHPAWETTGTLGFYVLAATLLWHVFGRAMYVSAGEVFTGVDNNLGDLPFHISIINSFARGDNFPPQHTEYAGVRLTYPFVIDFVSAMFLRAGASLQASMFWPGFALAMSLVGLLHRWALKLTRDRIAALITPVLVLLSGGFGWWLLLREASASGRGIFSLLKLLPHDYTSGSDSGYRWGNALTTLLVPQRGLLLGLPLAIIVWTLWWQATDDEPAEEDRGEVGKRERGEKGKRQRGVVTRERKNAKKNKSRNHTDETEKSSAATVSVHPRISSLFSFYPFPVFPSSSLRLMIAAGVVAGLMPLAHAHSFVVMMAMGGCLSLLFPRRWREWGAFFVAALVIAAPQMLWAMRGSAVKAESFFALEYGWDSGEQNVIWFWLKNTGLFIPLLVAALAWRSGDAPLVRKRLLFFFLPFTLCFVIPNVVKLSPWVWDNIKVLFYWYVASVPLVALVVARLWRERAVLLRIVAVGLLMVLTLAGGLDVWRVVSRASSQRIFDRDGSALAGLIIQRTPPRSLILHAPTYNHPVFLTGRRSQMGYAGHLWSQGIDYAAREREVRGMFAGGGEAEALLKKNKIEYVVVSPLEQSMMPVSRAFFERYEKVGEVGAYSLYKTSRP